MDKKVLKALKGSIQKWHDIAYHGGEDLSQDNCPLCLHFLDKHNGWVDCEKGCPVWLKTKEVSCEDTPYMKWAHSCSQDNSYYYEQWKATTPQKVKLAEEELKFLVTLLPEGEEAKMKDGDVWCWEWQ
jgi:hypothetical protein